MPPPRTTKYTVKHKDELNAFWHYVDTILESYLALINGNRKKASSEALADWI